MTLLQQKAKLRMRRKGGKPAAIGARMTEHDRALVGSDGLTGAIVTGICAWHEYADAHKARYESPIGEDYVLGPAWLEWAKALRTLLNGETGNLDCGTLDAAILDAIRAAGFGESDL